MNKYFKTFAATLLIILCTQFIHAKFIGFTLNEEEKTMLLTCQLVDISELTSNPQLYAGKKLVVLGVKPKDIKDPITFTPSYIQNAETHNAYVIKEQDPETFISNNAYVAIDMSSIKNFYTDLNPPYSALVVGKFMGNIKANTKSYPLIAAEYYRLISPDNRTEASDLEFINGLPKETQKLREYKLWKELDESVEKLINLKVESTLMSIGSEDVAAARKQIIKNDLYSSTDDGKSLEDELKSNRAKESSATETFALFNESGTQPDQPLEQKPNTNKIADNSITTKQPDKTQKTSTPTKTMPKSTAVPASITGVTGEDNIESMELEKTNNERTSRGLKPLSYSPNLVQSARQHSKEMGDMNYFSHYSPVEEYKDVSDRIHKAGSSAVYVGENIAMLPSGNVVGYGTIETPEQVAFALNDMWMKSPGHRENILRPEYNTIGIGIVYIGGKYYGTQNFGNVQTALEKVKTEPSEGKVKLTVTGKCLKKDGKIGAWDGGTFLGDIKNNADNSFAFSTVFPKNSGIHKIDIGVSESSGGSYSIYDTFTINTNNDYNNMVQY